jgi:hypothetical protein
MSISPVAQFVPYGLVFVDPALPDCETLIQKLPADLETIVLDPARDGLDQIAEALAGRSGVDAIHILSQGSPGLLHLGSSTVTLDSLAAHADALAAIGGALSETGNILLYGSDVAAGETGAAFLQALSEATGADVTAPAGIDWTFNDGNLGAQDVGGALDVTGHTTVDSMAFAAPITVAHPLADQSATQGQSFFYAVPADTFSDPDGTVVLSYTAARADGSPLPDWLQFDPTTRAFYGTPANGDVGHVSLEVTATDLAGGASATNIFDLAVANANDAPILVHFLEGQNATEHQPFSFQVPTDTFADPDVGDSLTYSAARLDDSPLPAWLGFDSATRTFSGTPGNGDGSFDAKVTATDAAGASVADHFTLTVFPVNDAPQIGGLSGTVTYTQGGPAVALAGAVNLADAELDAADSYAGATLTLARHGGANPDDVFEGSGTLTLAGDTVAVGGTAVGTYIQSGGILAIAFNGSATAALADSVAEQLAYRNASGTSPASVRIDWTFNDGNTGAQGSGGPLAISGESAVDIVAPCFLRGTCVLTRAGYRAVEDLTAGDELLTLNDGWQRLRWLGRRAVPKNADGRCPVPMQPIRIVQDAFGPGLPARDLWVSPEHAVFFRGHLIPAKALVNGATVIRDAAAEAVTYYHVLLERHAVVFSEALPTESYVPNDNVGMFENSATAPDVLRHGHGALPIGGYRESHPRVSHGPVVETARAYLARLAPVQPVMLRAGA